MSNESDEAERRTAKVVEEVLFGPRGRPEESLVVQVKQLAESMRLFAKFFWTMGVLGSGLIIERIWALVVNAN